MATAEESPNGSSIRWNFPELTQDSRSFFAKDSQLRQFVGDILELRGNERILDVGCGIGTLARLITGGSKKKALLNSGGEVFGIDRDPELVAFGNVHWGRRPNIHLRVGDANHIPFEPYSFDVVTSMGLFEWIQKPGLVFSEMTRVVNVPGKIITINIDSSELPYSPCSSRFKEFFTDLHRSYHRVGGDPQLKRFKALCHKWHIPLEKFSYTFKYEIEITENFIKLMQDQIKSFVSDRKIDELTDFNYQFLKHMGWTRAEVRDTMMTERSPEHNYKLYKTHLGECFRRTFTVHVYRILLSSIVPLLRVS